MLVLTRRQGESIVVGDEVEITVIRTTGATVKLGIVAPPNTTISRAELLHMPIWCDSKPDFCRGLSDRQISHGMYGKCKDCPCCNSTLLPDA